MNLNKKLEILKEQQVALEKKIADQQAARAAVLGSILPTLLEHPGVRKHAQSEQVTARLTKAQREALAAVIRETPEQAQQNSTNNGLTNAGGVLGSPKLENSPSANVSAGA